MHTVAATFYLAVIFALLTDAQTVPTSVTTRSGVVTSYFSVCPTASTTNTADASITGAPVPITVTGDDGRTTIYRTETTILPHVCPDNDGVCGATYTLSEQCPCEEAQPKTIWEDECPQGFTTTVVACKACEQKGGPATVTIVTPLPEGPYATVTPAYGQPAANPTDISQQPANPAASAQTPSSHAPGGSNQGDSGDNNSPAAPASLTQASGSDTENKYTPENDVSGANPGYSAPTNPGSNAPGTGGSNITKPFELKPYTGAAAGRTANYLGGIMSLVGTVVIGSLALIL